MKSQKHTKPLPYVKKCVRKRLSAFPTSKRRTPWIFQQRLGNTLKLSSGSLLEKSGDIPPPGGDFFYPHTTSRSYIRIKRAQNDSDDLKGKRHTKTLPDTEKRVTKRLSAFPPRSICSVQSYLAWKTSWKRAQNHSGNPKNKKNGQNLVRFRKSR
ncbi:hypothetical protein I4X13_005236 [Escherichia coli]|nr:hypothetical protein [Escherichia coli]EKX3439761.1 hypothetical protein [Escherichia coli]